MPHFGAVTSQRPYTGKNAGFIRHPVSGRACHSVRAAFRHLEPGNSPLGSRPFRLCDLCAPSRQITGFPWHPPSAPVPFPNRQSVPQGGINRQFPLARRPRPPSRLTFHVSRLTLPIRVIRHPVVPLRPMHFFKSVSIPGGAKRSEDRCVHLWLKNFGTSFVCFCKSLCAFASLRLCVKVLPHPRPFPNRQSAIGNFPHPPSASIASLRLKLSVSAFQRTKMSANSLSTSVGLSLLALLAAHTLSSSARHFMHLGIITPRLLSGKLPRK
jgi:hypothetical protein